MIRRPFNISNLRGLVPGICPAEGRKHYARLAARESAQPTEGDLLPARPSVCRTRARSKESGWPASAQSKSGRPPPSPPLDPTADALYDLSRKLIPNYYWFLGAAVGLFFASWAGPIDLRIPLLTAIALTGLLVTLFGSVQWEFRYPFDPIFTAFTLYAGWSLKGILRARRMAWLFQRCSTAWRKFSAFLGRREVAR